MNPIRREVLNGLLVLVVASLLSVAFSAFQVSFNAQLWVLILIGVAVAVSSYVMFEITLKHMALAEEHEKEWLKRIGTPAKLEMYPEGPALSRNLEALRTLNPGSDYTAFSYFGGEGGGQTRQDEERRRDQNLSLALERTKGGTLREYKRIICFDHDVFTNDPDLRAGILRSGSGAGTIDRAMGDHCRLMLATRGCSLFVAPAILQNTVVLYGTNKVAMSVETAEAGTGRRVIAGFLFFCDPPNAEIVEQFRQIERATERHMVAVHKIVFPEDVVPTAEVAAR